MLLNLFGIELSGWKIGDHNSKKGIHIVSLKLKIIASSILMMLIVACSDSSDQTKACEAPVDSVSIISNLTVNGTTYYLVRRVAGWHDKVEILELYNQMPIFDQCAKSHVESIFGDSLELDSTVSHVYLNPITKKLNITYIKGIPEGTHNESLQLEIEPVK